MSSKEEIEVLKSENLKIKEENEKLRREIIRLHKEKEELLNYAYKDSLTTLYNRRGMQRGLENLSSKDTHAVVICDIDSFKAINDTYGHNAGDEVLKKVSDLINFIRRKEDLAVRFGGDEFIIVFKTCKLDDAKNKCITLSKLISEESIGFPITISFGISEYNQEVGFECALRNADIALYHSKEQGKNRVTIYGEEDIKNKIK